MDTKIPVIDLANLEKGQPTVEQTIAIGKACLEFGFFYVVNHGIGEELKGKVFEKLGQFLISRLRKKEKFTDITVSVDILRKEKSTALSMAALSGKKGYIIFVNLTTYHREEEKEFSVALTLGRRMNMSRDSRQ